MIKRSMVVLALLFLPVALFAQSSLQRFEFETVGGLQVMSSAPPTGQITGVYLSPWNDVIPRFGARAAVRPWRRVSRLLVEVMGTIAPQRAADATAVPLAFPPPLGNVDRRACPGWHRRHRALTRCTDFPFDEYHDRAHFGGTVSCRRAVAHR
jgi:hypothetical protein